MVIQAEKMIFWALSFKTTPLQLIIFCTMQMMSGKPNGQHILLAYSTVHDLMLPS